MNENDIHQWCKLINQKLLLQQQRTQMRNKMMAKIVCYTSVARSGQTTSWFCAVRQRWEKLRPCQHEWKRNSKFAGVVTKPWKTDNFQLAQARKFSTRSNNGGHRPGYDWDLVNPTFQSTWHDCAFRLSAYDAAAMVRTLIQTQWTDAPPPCHLRHQSSLQWQNNDIQRVWKICLELDHFPKILKLTATYHVCLSVVLTWFMVQLWPERRAAPCRGENILPQKRWSTNGWFVSLANISLDCKLAFFEGRPSIFDTGVRLSVFRPQDLFACMGQGLRQWDFVAQHGYMFEQNMMFLCFWMSGSLLTLVLRRGLCRRRRSL